MSLQLNLEVQDVQTIMGGLAKLPLEASLDTWLKVKTQAEQQLKDQQPAAPGEPADTPQADA